jgi:hypothetical protein
MTLRNEEAERLLGRAKGGPPLSAVDLARVKSELDSEQPSADPYTLLHVLWKSGDRESRTYFEKFLQYGLQLGDEGVSSSNCASSNGGSLAR